MCWRSISGCAILTGWQANCGPYEASRDRAHLDEAGRTFADEEPDLRRYFGAYEPLDTVLGILELRSFILTHSRRMVTGNDEHDFLVGERAPALLEEAVAAFPEHG